MKTQFPCRYLLLAALMTVAGWGQSFNATISGTVQDTTGATVPNAVVKLTSVSTNITTTFTTGPEGTFRFSNLQRGNYELHVSALGFMDFHQRGISVSVTDSVRIDVRLEVGAATQSIDVLADASPLNFESAELKQAVRPESIDQLPLIVSGNQRAVFNFALLVPGATTGASADIGRIRLSGGARGSEEGVLDGVSMQQGMMSQGGQTSMAVDYTITPDAIAEINVLTSNFEPQYGASNSAVVIATTKSGTNEFHGTVFEFLRNSALNARQFGGPAKSKNIEHDFGATIGGPLKVPGLWSGDRKTYFFGAFGRWYVRGATVAPTISIPSLKQRQGDFSDWTDANGNLIPVFDPATTRVNPDFDSTSPVSASNLPFLRNQFMGCDGKTPNVICPSDPRLRNSIAHQWLKWLPDPTYDTPLNNYVPPAYTLTQGDTPVSHKTSVDVRFDHHIGSTDHIGVNIHYHVPIMAKLSYLPGPLAIENFSSEGGAVGPWVHRVNWDHTFSPTLLNTLNFGYLNFRGRDQKVSDDYADEVPKIPNVPGKLVSRINLAGFRGWGGGSDGSTEARPTTIVNNLMTWVRGSHVFKFGGEYRYLTLTTTRESSPGTFSFAEISTGLPGITSGSSVASFLLEQVYSANASFVTVRKTTAIGKDLALHAGDTWRATNKLSINYGIRWDFSTPSAEREDNFSFFDPTGPNPGAAGRPGRLAFAGTKWGDASFGRRYPERVYYKAFAPRLGLAFTVRDKTVIRTGYGIFYNKNFYPGWGGGLSLTGFNNSVSFSSSDSGMTPAMILSEGFPTNFPKPPFIDSTYVNGQSAPLYRPEDANRPSYTQQWNFTIEQQLSPTVYFNLSYVGNKGTRLLSRNIALNALHPQYLALGQNLNNQFSPGMTELHGVSIPYPGWVEQMTSCAPTVAQALLPYPQYCGQIRGLNERTGNSTYHSFQLKAEKRLSSGTWMLLSYTLSKLLTDAEQLQGSTPPMSPFERTRNKSLASDDVPHTLSIAATYDLPFGRGKRFASRGGVLDRVVGGWSFSSIFRATSGEPFSFRSGRCNVPGQFAASCVPAILEGADPWAQDKKNYDPNARLFNLAAFESPDSFNFYWGKGSRVSNLRGFGYVNHDLGVLKNTPITERVALQLRGEFFNVWNMHSFTSNFTTDVNRPNFGMWTGGVTAPRNIQIGMRIVF